MAPPTSLYCKWQKADGAWDQGELHSTAQTSVDYNTWAMSFCLARASLSHSASRFLHILAASSLHKVRSTNYSNQASYMKIWKLHTETVWWQHHRMDEHAPNSWELTDREDQAPPLFLSPVSADLLWPGGKDMYRKYTVTIVVQLYISNESWMRAYW